ncbi:MAG TPA: hypothetical protein VHI51_05405 [Ktedonobacterales bacterium]|jgi:hypothetical protein|nr:hypothetical protein [Ktedonobacterales bacterium]
MVRIRDSAPADAEIVTEIINRDQPTPGYYRMRARLAPAEQDAASSA